MQALYSLLLAISCIGILFSGCKEDPTAFSPENAIEDTQPKLAEYAAEHHVPLKEFKGPYLLESKGLEFPTYSVCYKHPKHFFCYYHYGSQVDAAPMAEIEEKTEKMKWLEAQK